MNCFSFLSANSQRLQLRLRLRIMQLHRCLLALTLSSYSTGNALSVTKPLSAAAVALIERDTPSPQDAVTQLIQFTDQFFTYKQNAYVRGHRVGAFHSIVTKLWFEFLAHSILSGTKIRLPCECVPAVHHIIRERLRAYNGVFRLKSQQHWREQNRLATIRMRSRQ